MTRAAEGGALPEGVERALLAFARAMDHGTFAQQFAARRALRAAILAAIAPPVAGPVAWGVADRTGRVVITGERRSYCEAVKATYDDEMPSGRPFAIVPLYAKPPVAPSCSASFDAALAALDYQPVDVRDNGTHVYELLGLDDVRAAHAEEVRKAVRVAVEKERAECAHIAHTGSCLAFAAMAGAPKNGPLAHTSAEAMESVGKSLAECERQIRARKEPS